MEPVLTGTVAYPNESSSEAGFQTSSVVTTGSGPRRRGDFCIRLHAYLADKTFTGSGGWAPDGIHVIIQDPEGFASQLQAAGLGSGRFANIRRQLHAYDFKKSSTDAPLALVLLLRSLYPDTQCWVHPVFRRNCTLLEVQSIPRKPETSVNSKTRQRTPPARSNSQALPPHPPAPTPDPLLFQSNPFSLSDPLESWTPDLYESASSVGGSISDWDVNDEISVDEGYGGYFQEATEGQVLGTQDVNQLVNSAFGNEPYSPNLLPSLNALHNVQVIEPEPNAVVPDWDQPWNINYPERVVHHSNAYLDFQNQFEHGNAVFESGANSASTLYSTFAEGGWNETSSGPNPVQSTEWC